MLKTHSQLLNIFEQGKQAGLFNSGFITVKKQNDPAEIYNFESNPNRALDIGSITKPIVIATGIALLLQEGKVSLQEDIHSFDSDMPGPGIKIYHLLGHTAGVPDEFPDSFDGEVSTLCLDSYNYNPGQKFLYSDVGYFLLGKIIEKVVGLSLDEFANRSIFSPLGLKETGYRINDDQPEEEVCRKILNGVSGHAGLMSNATELTQLIGEWTHGKEGLISKRVRDLFLKPSGPGNSDEVPYGLGWMLTPSSDLIREGKGMHLAGELLNGFGHFGMTGASLWYDRPSQSTIVIYTKLMKTEGLRKHAHILNAILAGA